MKNNKKGFTIVELVIVIAVIGILAGVLIPTFSNVVAKGQESAAQQKAAAAMKQTLAQSTNAVITDGTYFLVLDQNLDKKPTKMTYAFKMTNASLQAVNTDTTLQGLNGSASPAPEDYYVILPSCAITTGNALATDELKTYFNKLFGGSVVFKYNTVTSTFQLTLTINSATVNINVYTNSDYASDVICLFYNGTTTPEASNTGTETPVDSGNE